MVFTAKPKPNSRCGFGAAFLEILIANLLWEPRLGFRGETPKIVSCLGTLNC